MWNSPCTLRIQLLYDFIFVDSGNCIVYRASYEKRGQMARTAAQEIKLASIAV